jgi:hypothetical protein
MEEGPHPMTAWADHGQAGNGESLALVLRPGNAGSNTAADHVEAARLALASCRSGCGARCWSGPIRAAARTSS